MTAYFIPLAYAAKVKALNEETGSSQIEGAKAMSLACIVGHRVKMCDQVL